MNTLSKVLGLGSGAAVAAVFAMVALTGTSNAAMKETGLCQSATVPGVISCCKRYIKTRNGMNWLNSGGSCNSHAAVVCKGGGKSPVAATHAVATKKICYLKLKKKAPIKFLESHDHAPPNTNSNNNPTNNNTNNNPNKP